MTLSILVIRYALFAAVATAINLGAQRLILATGTDPLHFAAAMIAGTLAGLVAKYLLDKRWIFHDTDTGLRQHGTKFSLYALMGLATTAIFWGAETGFWLIGKTTAWRETGAVLGLAGGYVIKYRLDRRFVFNQG